MTEQDELAGATWWKARASGDSGGCVEFAQLTFGGAVRDSKYIAGGALRGRPEAMEGLVISAKNGALTAP
ncbi:DUF397 domain-containing protein (plasmid) [Lentzea sp. JNUCC 0626]|uniref:DUF397 domain-containing protein n=1 Tax=Lentzea sp. JNUCC 0626 TaxID=3367513 RepID=UPI003748803B